LETITYATVFHELHDYARVEFQIYVAWFTFFLTLLLGSMAWSLRASLDRQGRVAAPFPYYCMVALFTVQLIFGIIGTGYIADDLKQADLAGLELQKTIVNQTLPLGRTASSTPALDPFPQGIHSAMKLMQWTLGTNLGFWLIVTVLVARRRGKKLAGSIGD
jgi:hypothetical protein